MSGVFAILVVLSLIGLVWGLVAPHHIAKVVRTERVVTRKHTSFIFTALFFVFFMLLGVTAPRQPADLSGGRLTSNIQSTSPQPVPAMYTH